MKNLRKIFLTTFTLSALTNFACYGMYGKNTPTGMAPSKLSDERHTIEISRGRYNAFVNHLILSGKVQPKTEVAAIVDSISMVKFSTSDACKKEIKKIADLLKEKGFIDQEEYDKLEKLIQWNKLNWQY